VPSGVGLGPLRDGSERGGRWLGVRLVGFGRRNGIPSNI
jgi:hypothetical protein